jgi:low molecular weight phosphotyrosine protein phosphatase
MDRDNLGDVEDVRKRYHARKIGGHEEGKAWVGLFGEFGGTMGRGRKGEEVEDPYYGGNEGFETAYEQVDRFSKAFLKMLEDGTEEKSSSEVRKTE